MDVISDRVCIFLNVCACCIPKDLLICCLKTVLKCEDGFFTPLIDCPDIRFFLFMLLFVRRQKNERAICFTKGRAEEGFVTVSECCVAVIKSLEN